MPIVLVAAVVAGGAVAAGVVAASAVIYAGIAVSVVGKVTKSKELSQIGSGMTLGAGVAGAASSIFGAAEGATAGGMTAENAALGGADGLGGTGIDATAGSLSADVAGSAAGADGAVTGLTQGIGGGAETVAGAGDSAGLLNPSSTSAATSSAPAATAPAGAAAEGGAMNADNLALGGADGMGGTGVIAPPAPGGIQGWWANLSATTKAKLLSGAADAAMKGWDQNQKNEFEREKFNLSQQQYNTSMANASAQPVVKFAPVKTGGLLNPTARG